MSKVVIVRKDKRIRHKLLHALAFAATGGASGVITAARVASDASYNARTRQLQSQGESAPRGQTPRGRRKRVEWTPEELEYVRAHTAR